MMHDLRTEIQVALNRQSCLSAFDRATVARIEWHKPLEHVKSDEREHVISDTEECWCEPTVVHVPAPFREHFGLEGEYLAHQREDGQ